MIHSEAIQAARKTADDYRAAGSLQPLPADDRPVMADDRPVMDVVKTSSTGLRQEIPVVHVHNARRYTLTLKAYRWLADNPED